MRELIIQRRLMYFTSKSRHVVIRDVILFWQCYGPLVRQTATTNIPYILISAHAFITGITVDRHGTNTLYIILMESINFIPVA